MSMPQDMTRGARDMATLPPDMVSLQGVTCGGSTCTSLTQSDCCVSNQGAHCVDGTTTMCNGALFTCDGPEDCSQPTDTCCGMFGAGGGAQSGTTCTTAPGTATGCTGLVMCHVTTDCPDGQGFVACCPLTAGSPYKRCSLKTCP